MPLTVNVRLGKYNSSVIDISEAEKVEDVKDLIAEQCGLVYDFKLLFSGKILHPQTAIKDLCLGSGSILHLFTNKESSVDGPLVDVEASKKEDTKRYQYFVYCKVCNDLYPGKLRVRCSKCLQGAIILNQEPNSWEDVLLPDQIEGHCNDCDTLQTAQFYFKCCHHDGIEESSPLRHVKPNRRHIECTICTEERCPVLVYPCPDKHVVCVDCFQTYAQTCLDQRTFVADPDKGYSLPCPVGCENSLIKDTHHFQVLGKQQYERYKDFGAEECVLQSGGVFCPNVGCGEALIVDNGVQTVQCRTCQYEFCRGCRQEVHSGSCHLLDAVPTMTGAMGIDQERALRSRWDVQSMDTIKHTTKPCPKCKVKTEKSGGCMHMKCSRCSLQWCWVCETPWNRSCQGDHWFG